MNISERLPSPLQRTTSLPRSTKCKTALQNIAWFRKPRSHTAPLPSTQPQPQPRQHQYQQNHSKNQRGISEFMTQLEQQHDSNSTIAPAGGKRMQTDGRQATTQMSSSPRVPTRTLSLRRVPEATDMAAEFQNQIINMAAASSALTFPSHDMPSPNSAGYPAGSIGQKLAKMAVAAVPSGNVTDGKAGNLHATTALEVRADLVSKQQRLVSQRPVSPAMSEGSTASVNGSVGGGVGGKGFEKVLQMFPEVLLENPKPPRDFVCSLDHAGIRWYGRIFIGSSCMCFSGTGISLSGGTKRSNSNSNNTAGPQGSNIGVFAWRTALNNNSLMSLASSQGPGHPVFGSLPRLTKVAAVLSAQIPNTPLSTTEFDSSAGGSKKPWRRTAIRIQFRDITRVSKELTMGFWPNVITVGTTHRQYIFTNFLRRDRAHRCLSEAWQKVKDQIAAETLRLKSPPISYALRPAAAAGPWVTQGARRRKQPRVHNLSDSTAISSATSTAAIAQCESEMTICEGPTELSPSSSPDCAKTASQSYQDSTPMLEAKSMLLSAGQYNKQNHSNPSDPLCNKQQHQQQKQKQKQPQNQEQGPCFETTAVTTRSAGNNNVGLGPPFFFFVSLILFFFFSSISFS